MRTRPVGPSEWLWKPGAGYYTEETRTLRERPILPDEGRLRDRRILALFAAHGALRPGARVLEIGCGRSPWLPALARRFGCAVTGIDIEPHAADLARANLAGAGAAGEVICRDAFECPAGDPLRGRFDLVYSMGVLEHFDDVVARIAVLCAYLAPGGRLLTTVPNLQGLNWVMQRLADRRTLEAHVVYDTAGLARVHREAGLRILASGYAGFLDAHLSSAAGAASPVRRRLHRLLCRALGMCGEAWLRLAGGRGTPDTRGFAPHVFCVGQTEGGPPC